MVYPDSHGISRVPWYSGNPPKTLLFRLRGSNPLWPAFPDRSSKIMFGNFVMLLLQHLRLLQHHTKNASRLTIIWFRLFPVRSPLLRESRLMSCPGGTEMYQFPPFAFLPYFTRIRIIRLPPNWVFPFGDLRVTGWLAPHRSVSSPPPSFIASQSQGILHALVLYLKSFLRILEICRKNLLFTC